MTIDFWLDMAEYRCDLVFTAACINYDDPYLCPFKLWPYPSRMLLSRKANQRMERRAAHLDQTHVVQDDGHHPATIQDVSAHCMAPFGLYMVSVDNTLSRLTSLGLFLRRSSLLFIPQINTSFIIILVLIQLIILIPIKFSIGFTIVVTSSCKVIDCVG
jgi:hypothetical protein